MPAVFADPREPALLLNAIEEQGIPLTKVLMEFDYLVVGHKGLRVAVERKSGFDLLTSIADGRLAHQARAMTAGADMALVVCDPLRNYQGHVQLEGQGTGWQYKSVLMQLISLALAGVEVLQVDCPFPEFLSALVHWAGKERHESIDYHLARAKNKWSILDPKAAGLAALIPGLGPKKAAQLLRHFGSLQACLAEVERWTEVPGIGPKMIDRAKKFLAAKYKEAAE